MTVIVWFRNDLRLADNPALKAAIDTGEHIVPLYVLDDDSPGIWRRGGASRWWLHNSLAALDGQLQKSGFQPMVYLKGNALVQVVHLYRELKASSIFWNRLYEPWAMERDKRIKEELGKKAQSFDGFLMFEPWTVQNKTGGQYKVFTPFSKACLEKEGDIRTPLSYSLKSQKVSEKTVSQLSLKDLTLMPQIKWYEEIKKQWQPGEEGAQIRLKTALSDVIEKYKQQRDFPALEGVSRLSPHLHFGEISPHQIWHAVRKAGIKGDSFLRQLIWREFSYHLLYHDHTFPEQPWNKQFLNFPWKRDEKLLSLWKQGRTGYPIVDAGMRQLWQTGWMHNRVRMIVGSFLVKNLLQHWRDGEDWFWDTLVDADLGNNAAGWQWIAGCGADAAPYFRIFNPILQSRKFDPQGEYIRRYVPELRDFPIEFLHAPWEAPPLVLQSLKGKYPAPIIDHATARDRALEAYHVSKSVA